MVPIGAEGSAGRSPWRQGGIMLKFCAAGAKNDKFCVHLHKNWKILPLWLKKIGASAVPIGAAGEKFLKLNTFSCIFKAKNDKVCAFSLKLKKFCLYNWKRMVSAVPIGATGEKFSKLNTFLCIFKAIFSFLKRQNFARRSRAKKFWYFWWKR